MKFHFIILFSLFIFSGCVKNTISIHVNPKGDFEMIIHAHGDEEDIGDMSIDGYNVNSETIRGCLAKLSGYGSDVNSKEGRQKLFEHLRATLRPDAESGSISFNSEESGDSVEIGKEQYRTKGVGNNSVMGNFGKDLQKCMKNKVTK